MQAASEIGAGVLDLERERLACRPHPALAHFLAEGGHRQLLRDLRLAHEGAAPAPPDEIALPRQLVDRSADGEAGDAEVLAQLPLGGDGVTDAHVLNQVDTWSRVWLCFVIRCEVIDTVVRILTLRPTSGQYQSIVLRANRYYTPRS